MKVFWSWQSDTPRQRHFIREALDEAVAALAEDADIEPAVRDEIHVDQDRQGVAGSPDLASTIFGKIEESAVFVADVTPTGSTPDGGKKLINPNVAIELGYAIAHLGDERILLVMNEEHGSRDDLPFDLRHKAGPIMFSLSESDSREDGRAVRNQLAGVLRRAVRQCVGVRGGSGLVDRRERVEENAPTGEDRAKYFEDNEGLVQRNVQGVGQSLRLRQTSSLLYLRLIPTSRVAPLRRTEILTLVHEHLQPPLTVAGGHSWGTNPHGGIRFSSDISPPVIHTLTQLFKNRELWGIDAWTLGQDDRIFPAPAVERVFISALRHHVQVATEHLQLEPPFTLEAGAVGLRGLRVAMPPPWRTEYWERIQEDEVRLRRELPTTSSEDTDAFLLSLFEQFFDAAAQERPENFRGFPEQGSEG